MHNSTSMHSHSMVGSDGYRDSDDQKQVVEVDILFRRGRESPAVSKWGTVIVSRRDQKCPWRSDEHLFIFYCVAPRIVRASDSHFSTIQGLWVKGKQISRQKMQTMPTLCGTRCEPGTGPLPVCPLLVTRTDPGPCRILQKKSSRTPGTASSSCRVWMEVYGGSNVGELPS